MQSDLKFAAYGEKFINNYLFNIPHYVRRMNDAQNDDSVKEVKKCKYSGYLAMLFMLL